MHAMALCGRTAVPILGGRCAGLLGAKLRAASPKRAMSFQAGHPEPLVTEATDKHVSSIICIHGLGDTGAGWTHVGDDWGASLPNTKFIFPTATERPVTLKDGEILTAWYDARNLDKGMGEDRDGLLESLKYISSLVQAEVDAGIDSRKVVVAGFSQGGAVSLLCLRQELPLGGVLCLSGRLTLAGEPKVFSEANKQTPVLICHGEADNIVAYRFAAQSFQTLRDAGAHVALKSYEGVGHTLAAPEKEDIKAFLQNVLS